VTPPSSAGAARALPARGVPGRAPVSPTRRRRISGPARPRQLPGAPRQPGGASAASPAGGIPLQAPALARRAWGLVAELPGHPVLERLIRGRAWIALIAFALIGIVTLQLLLLQLNGGIGRALVREGTLQRENAALALEDAELAASERVETLARGLGMQFSQPAQLVFLTPTGVSAAVRKAAAVLRSAASKPAQAQVDAGSQASQADETGQEASPSTQAVETGSGEAAAAGYSAAPAASPGEAAGEPPGGTAGEAAGPGEAAGVPAGETAGASASGELQQAAGGGEQPPSSAPAAQTGAASATG